MQGSPVLREHRHPVFSADEARVLAREAYIYGYPIVDSYRLLHAYFVDQEHHDYKGRWNEIHQVPPVFIPGGKPTQTTGGETLCAMVGLDLRREPMVLSVPAVEEGRYYSVECNDLHTFIFAYIGTRATGNSAGHFLITGPYWHGKAPRDIKAVIACETEMAFLILRTQMFDGRDAAARKIHGSYHLTPLSRFSRQSPPPPPAKVNFHQPLSARAERNSLEFFNELNFVLQFCPVHATEKELAARLARLGIGRDGTFNPATFSAEVRLAIDDGMVDAWRACEIAGKAAQGEGTLRGSRGQVQNHYLNRMVAALEGLWDNAPEEVTRLIYHTDAEGHRLDGKSSRYTLRFTGRRFPPVNAFWTLSLYHMPTQAEIANPLDRHRIDSSHLDDLKHDPDGGVTLYIQRDSPGPELEANWLPTPTGPFMLMLRLYWPKPEALAGVWIRPPVVKVGP